VSADLKHGLRSTLQLVRVPLGRVTCEHLLHVEICHVHLLAVWDGISVMSVFWSGKVGGDCAEHGLLRCLSGLLSTVEKNRRIWSEILDLGVVQKQQKIKLKCLIFLGAAERTRTVDLLITNQLLYQLSYSGLW
jgi:hypothetical protein